MPANSAVLELPPKGAGFLPKSPKDGPAGFGRIDMTCRTVYFNGEFVSEQEARVSIFDSALMFGDMVFDMTRTYGQKPFRLKEHLERIYAGLKYLEIDCGLTLEEMERATLETLERNLPVVDGAGRPDHARRLPRTPARVQERVRRSRSTHRFHQLLALVVAPGRQQPPVTARVSTR